MCHVLGGRHIWAIAFVCGQQFAKGTMAAALRPQLHLSQAD